MRQIRTGAHTQYELKYHLAWVTKYRFPVLTGKIGLRLRAMARIICSEHDVQILSGRIAPEHVHLLLSAPPNLAPAKLAQYLKGTTSRKLQMEFPGLKKRYWGQHLWARGYFIGSTGTVGEDAIRSYFEHHDERDTGDDFRIVR